jgi:adenylate kinase family enzyme
MFNNALIIGICGPQGAGKSYLAHKLCEYVNSIFLNREFWQCECFAKSLYEITEILCGIQPGTIDKSKIYSIGNLQKTGREWLQFVGTEIGRDIFGEDIWVNSLLNRIVNDVLSLDAVVVHDLRFKNESQICDFIIYIESKECQEQVANHRSESFVEQLKQLADIVLIRDDKTYKIYNTKHNNSYYAGLDVDFKKIYHTVKGWTFDD